jgi:signal transduction histidine kinase
MVNIVQNAIKFSTKGTIEISAKRQITIEGGRIFKIKVRD